MRYTEIILLLALIGGTVYNVHDSLFRMFLIGLWLFLPFIFIFLSYNSKLTIKKSMLKELIYAIVITLVFIISIAINHETFKPTLEPFKILCQSGKIINTQGETHEDRNRCRAICS